jgi:hypothetical protein
LFVVALVGFSYCKEELRLQEGASTASFRGFAAADGAIRLGSSSNGNADTKLARLVWVNPLTRTATTFTDVWRPSEILQQDLPLQTFAFETSPHYGYAIVGYEAESAMTLGDYFEHLRSSDAALHGVTRNRSSDPTDTVVDFVGPVLAGNKSFDMRGRLFFGSKGVWRVIVVYPRTDPKAGEDYLLNLYADIKRTVEPGSNIERIRTVGAM